jgi:hypothetical protein
MTCLALNWQLMGKQPQIVRKLVMGCDYNALSTSIILWSPCSSKNLLCAKETTETSCMQGKKFLQIKCVFSWKIVLHFCARLKLMTFHS